MGQTISSDDECFEWDEEKAITNKKKHGIVFEKALTVFFDPRKIEFRDASHSDHEERYLTIGNASRIMTLLVTIRPLGFES